MKLLPHWLVEKLKASFPSQIAMDIGQSQRKRKRAEEESTEGVSTSSSISRESTVVGSGQYDVFLSFRGSDTRKEFTDHLYHSLVKAGTVPFCVFKDDKSIAIGEEFGSQIFDAIARTKISIPIISENYASSKWCLRELIHMMDCKKSALHIVLPIFYKVTPSDVRHLKGKFGNAFNLSQKHFDEKDIQKGPSALNEVSHLHGWESAKFAGGHEGELIKDVVKIVISKLREDFQLNVPKQLVGLDVPMEEIMNQIDSPSTNARMIGIYGMGGIGKTTLAKCIYNHLLKKFVHVSFLSDVRETVKRHGIMHLQGLLISEILKDKMEVSTIDYGINIIKSRFNGKKVLILLDDVDDNDQLDALARECDWFMKGSLIIVTTRNKTVLDQSEFKVVYKYGLNKLNEAQALLLFNRHAFRMDQSPEDFQGVSRDIIFNMGGLPLALKAVGSQLYGKTNPKVWEDVQKKLKSQPHRDVQKILQISYDVLEDNHKQIFLDIACFFIGQYKDNAIFLMWEGCGLYPSEGIEELKLRCLIKMGDLDRFEMHDQLRDLGRSIFCKGQPLEARSGPWDKGYKGIARVVKSSWARSWFNDRLEAASSGDSNQLLSEVRYLKWDVSRKSDLSLWTTNLRLPNLLVLSLMGCMTEEWEGWSAIKVSNKLRYLSLFLCYHLRCTPDLSAFTRLKFLNLTCCCRLELLHPSIGKLKSLVSLDLTNCSSLKELPDEVGELDDLEELTLGGSGITKIPTSIGSLKKLKKLDLRNCESLRGIPSSIGRLENLRTLKIASTPISDVPELPSGIISLSISCWSPRLPQLSTLIHLEKLTLCQCRRLEDIPEFASSLLELSVKQRRLMKLLKPEGCKHLEQLSIKYCQSFKILDLSQLIHLKQLKVELCVNFVEVQGLDKLEFLEKIDIRSCESFERLVLSESRCLNIFIDGCKCGV